MGATEKFNFNKKITDDLLLVARWDRYVVQIIVYDGNDSQLEGAEVKVGGLSGKTNEKGEASFLLANGEHTYTVSLANYETQSGRLVVQDRDLENKCVTLYKPSQGGSTPTPPLGRRVHVGGFPSGQRLGQGDPGRCAWGGAHGEW